MKKRIISMIMFICMVVSCMIPIAVTATASEAHLPFTDVSEKSWFYSAVQTVYEAKIMEGKTENIFAPNEGTTRAQVVAILYRLAGADEQGLGKKLTFTDTKKDAWYSDYLGWAVQEKLVSGYPEGDFRPNDMMSRQELAKIIVEFIKYVLAEIEENTSVTEFSDKSTFPEWSAEYIENLRKTGIVVGDQNGNFNPKNIMTRAEIATVIERLLPAVNQALTPLPPTMGWSTYNCVGLWPNEQTVIEMMDAMVEKGLVDVGYQYVNIDDGWTNGRDETTGRVNYHEERFPNGMKYIADEAHKRGLKAGIYTDLGRNTCGGSKPDVDGFNGMGVGLYDHPVDDLWTYLGEGIYEDTYAKETGEPGVECWGFDFIKIDSCGLGGEDREGVDASAEILHNQYYSIVKDIERTTGKNKIYNMCRWFYDGPYLLKIGDSWRSGTDLFASWDSISTTIEKQKRVGIYTIPGHYGDTDMLQVGNGSLTAEENRSHFAMWCMFASPLVLGCDLREISDETLELVKNKELIAIDQDPVGKSAAYVETLGDTVELWFKKTVSKESGDAAIALYNKGNTEQTITLNLADICTSGRAEMRDVFAHSNLGELSSYTVTIAPHDTAVFTIKTENGYVKDCYDVYGEVDIDYDIDIYGEYDIDVERDTIDAETAKRYMNTPMMRPMLIDVRSAEEYEAGHLEGAINIEYKQLVSNIDRLPDTTDSSHLIVYCSAGKRSTQAYYELKRLRYQHVFILDDMNSY